MGTARGEVKMVGLFDENDQICGQSLDGVHGVVLFCTPDEAKAVGPMVFKIVDLVPEGAHEKLRAENNRLRDALDRLQRHAAAAYVIGTRPERQTVMSSAIWQRLQSAAADARSLLDEASKQS